MEDCIKEMGSKDVCTEILLGDGSEDVEEEPEEEPYIDMDKVVKLSIESRYNPLLYSNIQSLVLTSLQDEVIIENIKANRGKCKVDKSTIRYNKGKIEALKLPITLGFSESAKFTLRSGCSNLLEVEVYTNYGGATWSIGD